MVQLNKAELRYAKGGRDAIMENRKTCRECGAPLGSDDIAINQKLISRNVQEFFCIDCLAQYCKTTREAIQARIDYYRKSGHCTLFR